MARTGSTPTSARFAVESSDSTRPRSPKVSWHWAILVAVGAAVAVLAQWLALAGIIAPSWLGAGEGQFPDILIGACSFWLAGHGVPVDIIGVHIGLIPLGLTCLSVLLGEETCRYGTRAMWHQTDRNPSRRQIGEAVAIHTSVELVAAVLMAAAIGASQWPAVVIGSLLVGLCAGLIGAVRGARVHPLARYAAWVRGLVRAVGSTVAICLSGGAAVVAVALIVNSPRVVTLHQGIGADGWGGVSLILLQLAWLPTVSIWGTSWTLGAGFGVGTGTYVSPLGTHLGVVPAIPMLGALPGNGPLSPAQCAWFAVPVAAAITGGLIVTRSVPDAGFEIGAGLGALTGLASGVVVGILGLLARGSLGDNRLAEVGTAMPAMLGCAVGGLTLVAMLTGLVIGLIRTVRLRRALRPSEEAESEETGWSEHTVSAGPMHAAGGDPTPAGTDSVVTEPVRSDGPAEEDEDTHKVDLDPDDEA